MAAERTHTHTEDHSKKPTAVVSGTPADTLHEVSEHRSNKWIAIYISTLAVLLAIGIMGGSNATKSAQQAGVNVVDTYAYYQAKTIRQGQLRLAVDQLRLRSLETPNADEAVKALIASNSAAYQAEINRIETDGKNGKKELLAKAENCENERKVALAKDPYFDYSGALLQIAIVLASASIVAGARVLLFASGITGVLGVLLMLNGFTLTFGAPDLKTARAEDLKKAGVTLDLKCVDEG